jgi:hypothetical protein
LLGFHGLEEAFVGVVQLVEGLDAVVQNAPNRIEGALELLTQLVFEGGIVHMLGELGSESVNYSLILGHCELVVIELVVDQSEL